MRVPHKTKAQAQNFFLLEGELYMKGLMGYYSSAYLSQAVWKL